MRRLLAPAYFNSVLVIEDENEYTSQGISSEHRKLDVGSFWPTLLGLQVGEVQVIFKLLSCLSKFPHLLAYIHWFWPLQTFDKNVHSFHLSKSSCQHGPNALVVLVHQVLHPYHLIPWVGWELDMHEDFYLNRYIDLELFECLSV
jgi:hypothetical protein